MRNRRIPALTVLLGLVVGCTNTGTPLENDRLAGDRTSGSTDGENSGSTGGKDGTTSTNPAAPSAPGAPATPAAPAKSTMTFFVTSTGTKELGGNLGGLAGADKKCQDLAVAAAAASGDHTWHAYASVEGTNAKDRIGPGPWRNKAGTVIAASLEALHAVQFFPADADVMDEKGTAVPRAATAILTGTKSDGTAAPANQTCTGWTSATGNEQGRLGDAASKSSPYIVNRWNDTTLTAGCSQQALIAKKSEGRIYCFAID